MRTLSGYITTMSMTVWRIAIGVVLLLSLLACEQQPAGEKSAVDDSPLAEILAGLEVDEAQAKQEPVQAKQAATGFKNWYPNDITPPKGTKYPCALTALPRDLVGVPEEDKRFINHTYALILRAVQYKLLVMRDLGTRNEAKTFRVYARESQKLRENIKMQVAPNAKMKKFQKAVVKAISLQMVFFQKVIKRKDIPVIAQRFSAIQEGRQASNLLKEAWQDTIGSYPSLSPAVKKSLYHHLCALDVF